MTIEIRNNGITDVMVLVADEDKVLRRIISNEIIGDELWLGKSYYIGGVLQYPPHDDVPEDFDEIDRPEDGPKPEPYVEPELSDSEALQIITEGE